MYRGLLADEANLRVGVDRARLAQAKAGEVVDFSLFNYQTSRRMKLLYSQEVMKTRDVLARFGMPGLDLPSANAQSALARYDVNMDPSGPIHPALAILNSTYYNIDPRKSLMENMLERVTNPMTYQQLVSNMGQFVPQVPGVSPTGLSPLGRPPGAGQVKRMLLVDTETTGLGAMARIRSLSGLEITAEGEGGAVRMGSTVSNVFFRQPGMEGGLIRMPDGTVSPLGLGVSEIERTRSRTNSRRNAKS